MNEIQIEAYGKVNISLDVIGKRKDNYHEIETIMQQIDLKDVLIIRDRENEIKIECNNSLVPLDSSNIVHKAFKSFK
jgi:4-diphosphocytidyl-2-C-methyl-D-erythritol kinase